ncbi:poly polymerase and DNA-ligase Zn-finger region-domain-containing protein, partial [Protomyces lactucae-debilis]
YRIEYAKSGRAVCQNGECKKRALKIPKGAMRLGVWVDVQGHGSYKWRHYGCITDRVMNNMHSEFGS